MLEPEKVGGNRRFDILGELQRDETLLTIRVRDKNYSQLTVVTDVGSKKGEPYFLIDYPRGFDEAVVWQKEWRLEFEFTPRDGVLHKFVTTGGEIQGGEVWVRFPEVIERHQRRNDFRLDAPLGTRLHIPLEDTARVMSVIDVSRGGALVTLERGVEQKPTFKQGQGIRDLELEFPSKKEELKIKIKKARVLRLEKGPHKARYRYALQFMDVEKCEERRLTKLIYHFETLFLRERLKTDF